MGVLRAQQGEGSCMRYRFHTFKIVIIVTSSLVGYEKWRHLLSKNFSVQCLANSPLLWLTPCLAIYWFRISSMTLFLLMSLRELKQDREVEKHYEGIRKWSSPLLQSLVEDWKARISSTINNCKRPYSPASAENLRDSVMSTKNRWVLILLYQIIIPCMASADLP